MTLIKTIPIRIYSKLFSTEVTAITHQQLDFDIDGQRHTDEEISANSVKKTIIDPTHAKKEFTISRSNVEIKESDRIFNIIPPAASISHLTSALR